MLRSVPPQHGVSGVASQQTGGLLLTCPGREVIVGRLPCIYILFSLKFGLCDRPRRGCASAIQWNSPSCAIARFGACVLRTVLRPTWPRDWRTQLVRPCNGSRCLTYSTVGRLAADALRQPIGINMARQQRIRKGVGIRSGVPGCRTHRRLRKRDEGGADVAPDPPLIDTRSH